MKECENPKHQGDPTENLGNGYWWLKDPEWLWWCPSCNLKHFGDILNKALEGK